MTLDDHDPLFSEWSSGWQPGEPSQAARSLAPHEITFDDWSDEPLRAPVSPEHREKLQRYVKATVAACVVLCMAALARVGVTHVMAASEQEATTATLAAARAPEPPPLPQTVAVAAPVAVAVSAPVSAPVSVSVSAPVSAPVSVSVSVPAPVARTALQEREAGRRSLERGKVIDAIAAAERSTALDPTDAEAWLILGAAHQELGHARAARGAFRACTRSARRGPVDECAAMLR